MKAGIFIRIMLTKKYCNSCALVLV
jgi:hypothetical protein